MRTVEINGHSFKVKGLSRKFIKQLRADGYDLNNLKYEQVDEAMDLVFNEALVRTDATLDPVEAIEEMTYKYSQQLWRACLEETFLSAEELKNLLAAGSGPTTASG